MVVAVKKKKYVENNQDSDFVPAEKKKIECRDEKFYWMSAAAVTPSLSDRLNIKEIYKSEV